MSVLSFDVSVRSTGWSVLSDDECILGMGLIPTVKGLPLEDVLGLLTRTSRDLCNEFNPSHIVIENSYFGANIRVLKELEACRSAVKIACFEAVKIWPVDLWTKAYRSRFDISSKEEAFDYIKKFFGSKFMVFKKHNDITDSLLMALFAGRQERIPPDENKDNQIKSLLGILSGNKCVCRLELECYEVRGKSESLVIDKYKNIPDFVDSPIYYDRDGCCYFRINVWVLCNVDTCLFDIKSLYFILTDSMFSRGKFVYFRASQVLFKDIPAAALKSLDIKKLKTMYKMDKSVFLEDIVPKMRKDFGRKNINALLKGAKL